MALRDEIDLGDGLRAECYSPETATVPGALAGIVLVHEVFGLDAFVRGVAERLADDLMHAVIVPDLYSREGVPGPVSTEADPAPEWSPEQIRAAAAGLSDRRAVADLETATAALQERATTDPGRIAALGFCMGGKLAYLLGCQSRRLAAVVDFYGRIRYPELDANHPVQPLEMALGLECPLLAVFGENDDSIPPEDVDAMRERLTAFAKPFEIDVVPGVGHGFLNPLRGAYDQDAAEEVWARAQAFLEENL